MPKARYAYELPPHPVEYGVDVEIATLKIDRDAQRTLNEKRAQDIAASLVHEAVGSIVVSRRANGDLYIVDGQHRTRACELAGVKAMKAEVHHDLDRAQESVLFLIKNRESHKPRPIDEYRVGLTGGVALFVDTDKVLKAHNLDIGSSSTNSVGAIQGILRITDRYGADILDRTFFVAEWAWGRSQETWDGMLLGGIGMFLGRHGQDPRVDDRQLAAKLQKQGNAQWWRSEVLSASSRGGFHNSGTGSRITTCYRGVLSAYNKGRKAENKIEG